MYTQKFINIKIYGQIRATKWYMNSNVVFNVLHATVTSTTQIETHSFVNIDDSINLEGNVPYRVVESNCLSHFWITRETHHKVLKCHPFS